VITNDVSDYVNVLVRIAHNICNHPLYVSYVLCTWSQWVCRLSDIYFTAFEHILANQRNLQWQNTASKQGHRTDFSNISIL